MIDIWSIKPANLAIKVIAAVLVLGDRVVMMPPSLDQHLSLLERVEYLTVEQFVTKLCSAMPKVLQTSGTVRPLARPTSASRSLPMICSGVCRFRGILTSSQTVQA